MSTLTIELKIISGHKNTSGGEPSRAIISDRPIGQDCGFRPPHWLISQASFLLLQTGGSCVVTIEYIAIQIKY